MGWEDKRRRGKNEPQSSLWFVSRRTGWASHLLGPPWCFSKLLHRVKTSRPHPFGKEGAGMAGIRARLLEALATGPIFLHRGASSFAFSSSSCSLSSSSFAFSFSPFSLFSSSLALSSSFALSSLCVRPLFLVVRPLPRRSHSRLPGHPNFSVVFTERSVRRGWEDKWRK